MLVADFVGPGSEGVAQRVESNAPAFQAKSGQEGPQPVSDTVADRQAFDVALICSKNVLANPGPAVTCEEEQAGTCFLGRFRPFRQRLSQSSNSFRPQRHDALNARFGCCGVCNYVCRKDLSPSGECRPSRWNRWKPPVRL
jgi:hypothetical protein